MEEFKLRTMTMKHFSIPQGKSFSNMNATDLSENYGNYVSFYHHHFLEISACEGNRIASAYEKLCMERSKVTPGIRILQTLTMTGQENDFWQDEPAFLFVTLIQMKDLEMEEGAESRYKTLVKRLNELFSESQSVNSVKRPAFALYHAYDFCDFVLFAKNISFDRYNEILWWMATSEDNAFQAVRDTYSLYAFHTSTLLKAMHGEDSTELKTLSLSISLRLSIYSSSSFSQLMKSLEKYGIKFNQAFMFSRYDRELQVQHINGEQLAILLYELDRTYDEEPQPFGSYELMLLSSIIPSDDRPGKIPWRDNELIDAIMPLLTASEDQVDTVLQEYNREANRSLQELLQNGFSTEFLLGVIPAYLCSRSILSISNFKMKDWQYSIARQELSANAQQLFNALNTLTLSMMHGERRFIQAPAFNATYFDIPPKLFAYYAAVLSLTKEVYRDKTAKYSFLMVPDFRPGINVLPLPQKDGKDIKRRLAIVYLSERFFYDPLKAIPLIFHETAHYLSERHRKERAKEVFFSVSAFLLAHLPVGILLQRDRLDAFMKRQSLLGILAGELSDMMLMDYEETYCGSYISYGFISIQHYLQTIQYGIRLMSNAFTREILIQSWSNAILLSINDKDFNNECVHIFEGMEQNVGESQFLSAMYPRKLSCDILAAKVAKQVDDYSYEIGQQAQEDYYQYCENILFAYREAFADHRMLQVLGDGYSVTDYEELLQVTRERINELDYEFTLRHDAIMSMHFLSSGNQIIREPESEEDDDKAREEWLFYYTYRIVVSGIVRYLEKCGLKDISPNTATEIIEHLFDNAGGSQLRHIHCELSKYRNELINKIKDYHKTGILF